jgi:hypothetical protein
MLVSSATVWSLAERAQQPAMSVVALVDGGAFDFESDTEIGVRWSWVTQRAKRYDDNV